MFVMPLTKVCDKEMDSKYADVRNYPMHPWGGAITAAQFLHRFVKKDNLVWVHMDIAAAAKSGDCGLSTQEGASGCAVGTLLELLKTT